MLNIFENNDKFLILGVFFVISVNVNTFTEQIKDSYNLIEVYLEENISEETQSAILSEINYFDSIESVDFRTKEEALDIMKENWGENGYLLDTLTKNPLPNSYLVKINDTADATEIVSVLNDLDGVDSVKYFQEVISKLQKISNVIKYTSFVIVVFLLVISILVIANTIKLTVFARSKEIEIMRYIGASNHFIKTPFILEGIIIGLLSAGTSSYIIYLLYDNLTSQFGKEILTLLSTSMIPSMEIGKMIAASFCIIGIFIGISGSSLSAKKFLKK